MLESGLSISGGVSVRIKLPSSSMIPRSLNSRICLAVRSLPLGHQGGINCLPLPRVIKIQVRVVQRILGRRHFQLQYAPVTKDDARGVGLAIAITSPPIDRGKTVTKLQRLEPTRVTFERKADSPSY